MSTSELFQAVAANDLDLISLLLNRFDDPGSSELQSLLNQQDPTTGSTLAHIAAAHSSTDCLSLLIEYDIDVGRKNWDGLTPLGVANMNGRVEAAQLIRNNYIFEEEQQAWYTSIGHEKIRCSDDLIRLREAKCRSNVTRRIHPSALPSRPLLFEQKMRQERHEAELRLRAISARKIQAWWRRQ